MKSISKIICEEEQPTGLNSRFVTDVEIGPRFKHAYPLPNHVLHVEFFDSLNLNLSLAIFITLIRLNVRTRVCPCLNSF